MTRRNMVDVGLVETLLSSWMSDSYAVYGSDFEDNRIIHPMIDEDYLHDFCGPDRTWLHQCYRARPVELSIYRQAFDSARVTQFGMLRILHRVKNLRAAILTGTLLLLSTHLQMEDDSTDGSRQTILRQIATEISRAASVPHTNRGSVP